MKALLYKEFNLVIHPMFYLVPVLSALILIPQWLFFIAPLYFTFISAPNIFTLSKTYKELYFSASQPVTRRNIVLARVLSVSALEVLQILFAAVCVVIKLTVWNMPNYLFIDGNLAYLGLNFIMFGLFNIIMLPMFYRTAYKVGMPVILATIGAVLFAAGIELGIAYKLSFMQLLDGMQTTPAHIATLIAGILAFIGLNCAAYRISAKRLEKIDL